MKYSAEVRNKAKELCKGGMSCNKIAAQLGIGKSTVRRWIIPGEMEKSAAYDKEYNRIHGDRRREYRRNNKEKIAKRHKEYADDNKDKLKEYHRNRYIENKEMLCAQHALYVENNKEKVVARQAAYRKNNKEKIQEYNRIYSIEHREEILEKTRRRRYRMARGAKILKKHYDSIWKEQDGKCFYCGEPMSMDVNDSGAAYYYNVEHVNPVDMGGFHELSNIVYACALCNHKKHNKLVEKWMPSIMDKIYSHPRLEYDIEENNKRWLI